MLLAVSTTSVLAAETGQIRLGDDYDIFGIGGQDYRPCEDACNQDTRCRSWTFLKSISQCRLKHSEAPAFPNNCCISGLKQGRRTGGSDEAACADYAVKVLDDNDENLSGQCGYRGPLWTTEFGEAYGRCLDSSPQRREAENQQRSDALDECKKFVSRTAGLRCEHYGRMAFEEVKSNVRYNCGFRGDDWESQDLGFHINWCKSTKPGDLSARILMRERMMNQCLTQGGKPDPACQTYARTSVRQYRDAVNLRCGGSFSGTYWNADERQHYAWCIKVSQAERSKWVDAREQSLQECARDRQRRPKIILKF